jgi:hypothetical protein
MGTQTTPQEVRHGPTQASGCAETDRATAHAMVCHAQGKKPNSYGKKDQVQARNQRQQAVRAAVEQARRSSTGHGRGRCSRAGRGRGRTAQRGGRGNAHRYGDTDSESSDGESSLQHASGSEEQCSDCSDSEEHAIHGCGVGDTRPRPPITASQLSSDSSEDEDSN